MAGASQGDLVFRFTADISQLKTSVEQIQSSLTNMGKDIEGRFTSLLTGAVTRLGGALAAYASVNYFTGLIKNSIDAQDRLTELATKTGTTVEALSKLENVGRLSSTGIETITAASRMLTRQLASIDSPTNKAAAALKFLGINAQEFTKLPFDKQLELIAQKLTKYTDHQTKANIVQALFSRAGMQLLPLFKDLAENTDILASTTTEYANRADVFNDSLAKTRSEFDRLVNTVVGESLPMFQALFTGLGRWWTENQKVSGSLKDFVKDNPFQRFLKSIVQELARTIDEIIFLGRVLVSLQTILKNTGGYLEGVALGLRGAVKFMAGDYLGGFADVESGMAKMRASVTNAMTEVSAQWEKWKQVPTVLTFVNDAMEETANALGKVDEKGKKTTETFGGINREAARMARELEQGIAKVQAIVSNSERALAQARGGEASTTAERLLDEVKGQKWFQGMKPEEQLSFEDALTGAANMERLTKAYQEFNKIADSSKSTMAGLREEAQQLDAAEQRLSTTQITLAKEMQTDWWAQLAADWENGGQFLLAAHVAELKMTQGMQDGNAVRRLRITLSNQLQEAETGVSDTVRQQADLIRKQAEATGDWAQYQKDLAAVTRAMNIDIEKQNVTLNDEIRVYGLMGVERELALLQIQEERELYKELDPAIQALIRSKYAELRANVELRESVRQQNVAQGNMLDTLRTVDQYGESFFTSMSEGFEGLSNWAKRLASDLKNYLLRVLYELVARPFIITLAANILGIPQGIAGGFLQQTGGSWLGSLLGGGTGGGGGGGLFGNLFGGLWGGGGGGWVESSTGLMVPASEVGGGGLGGIFSNALSFLSPSNIASAWSTFGSTLTTAMTEGLTAAGGMSGILGAAGAALGPIAAIAGIGYLVYSLFGQKKGGPKTEGYAATGEVNLVGTGYTDAGRWMTGTGEDTKIAETLKGVKESFNAIAKGLGATADAEFALGYSIDKLGTAPSNVHVGAWVNGQLAFNAANPNVGRSEEEVQAEITLQTKRAILAALQATEGLADNIERVLHSLDSATASVEQIDKVVAFATALATVNDIMETLEDPEKLKEAIDAIVEASSATVYDQFVAMQEGLLQLAEDYDGTTESLMALSQATSDYGTALVNLLAQIQLLRNKMSSAFADLATQITLSLMSSAQKYQYYMDDITTQLTAIGTEKDPFKIEAMGQRILADYAAMWNLMSPEQQVATGKSFLQYLQQAQEIIDANLARAGADIEEAGGETIGSMATTFQTAVDDFVGATDTEKTASDTFYQGSLLFRQSVSEFDGSTIRVEVGSGRGTVVGSHLSGGR